jgi:hypothetical protein
MKRTLKSKTLELGDLARDRITGYKGVAVAKTEWINGCMRWTLQACKLTKDGAQSPTECFDEEQIAVVRKRFIAPFHRATGKAGARKPPGGPRPSPSRPPSPSRR